MQIDKIKVCEPITSLVDYLTKHGYEIVEKKVSDYHFHEVYIKMKSNNLKQIDDAFIEKIDKIDNTTYFCSCHWSIIEIVNDTD